MAVYYRYRSGVDTFSLPVPAPSISVGDLKRLILGTSRHGHGRTRGRGPREGIAISDAQTGEEYTDDRALVLRNSTVVAGAEDDDEAKATIDAAELKSEGPSRYNHRGAAYHGPPPHKGYVCRRCRVPGHFIQHCPTNGDPRFDFGKAAVLSPAPAAPEDDGAVPADLYCKICKKVMEDAVMTRKCCFSSFCDRCIRAHIVANSKCACGVHARPDDLIPNPALRTTISNILAARAGSASAEKTETQRSSQGSYAVAASTPHTKSPAASQDSHVSSNKSAAPAHGDGSESTSHPTAHKPIKEQETTAVNHCDPHYGYNVPFAPACYNSAFFCGMPWTADPSMYYGYGGGGYPMGNMTASYGYHGERHDGRKRAGCDDQRQHNRGLKRRCGGIRSQVALVLT
ncbi:unnamed protein product [Alopecurus aequalis]